MTIDSHEHESSTPTGLDEVDVEKIRAETTVSIAKMKQGPIIGARLVEVVTDNCHLKEPKLQTPKRMEVNRDPISDY